MPQALAKMYKSLTANQQEKVYDYVAAFCEQNSRKENEAEKILSAFDEAKVCVPITWTREEINERM